MGHTIQSNTPVGVMLNFLEVLKSSHDMVETAKGVYLNQISMLEAQHHNEMQVELEKCDKELNRLKIALEESRRSEAYLKEKMTDTKPYGVRQSSLSNCPIIWARQAGVYHVPHVLVITGPNALEVPPELEKQHIVYIPNEWPVQSVRFENDICDVGSLKSCQFAAIMVTDSCPQELMAFCLRFLAK